VFASNLTMGGLSNPTLDAASQAAVLNATAESMGISVNTVFFTGQIAFAENRRLSSASSVSSVSSTSSVSSASSLSLRRLTTSWTVLARTRVEISLGTTAYTDATLLYDSLTTSLGTAVAAGAYTESLNKAASALGASNLATADVTAVSNSAIEVDAPPTSSGGDDSLTVGEVHVGIAVGVAISTATFLFLLGIIYFLNHNNKARKARRSAQSAPQAAPQAAAQGAQDKVAAALDGENPMQAQEHVTRNAREMVRLDSACW
jgi:hypothetical protein